MRQVRANNRWSLPPQHRSTAALDAAEWDSNSSANDRTGWECGFEAGAAGRAPSDSMYCPVSMAGASSTPDCSPCFLRIPVLHICCTYCCRVRVCQFGLIATGSCNHLAKNNQFFHQAWEAGKLHGSAACVLTRLQTCHVFDLQHELIPMEQANL